MTSPLPSTEELETAYEEARRIHRDHLKIHQVRMPAKSSYKWIWIAMLFHFRPEGVHKDLISEAVRRAFEEAGADQQVRHLKRDGWNIEDLGKGTHALRDPYVAHPEFQNTLTKQQVLLNAKDFEGIKEAFRNRCATCGALEGEPDPRYGGDIVVLERGHKDPLLPLSLENTLPQCGPCNKAYRDDFVFDDRGRARAVASVGPVKRASEGVQEKIHRFLNLRTEKSS